MGSDRVGGRVVGRGAGWYRGDCHVHSVYSDGHLTPEQLAAEARTAGLDFIAATEHNTSAGHAAWSGVAGDDLLVILGEEVTTDNGHWLALGIRPGQEIDWRYRVRDGVLGRHLDEVHRTGGLCVAAHPHAPYQSGTFMYPHQGLDVIEVWNGLWASDLPWSADNAAALAEWGRNLAADIHSGTWRPAMGNSDTHFENQMGIPQTVVQADDFTTGAILAGIRAGRSWVAESSSVDLAVTLSTNHRTAGIGEQLETDNKPAVVRVAVQGVPSGSISVHTDRGTVHRASLPEDGAGATEWATTAEESDYVRIEVRHPSGAMAALTNPVILI
ncbi:CehA/McbA family metallohydrolase [Actinopolymorpha sp. B11F2]|uniref:CehA/McbA family metallohydrolase n=1 Tax=Actinopolymorpha sp. B11F2 TaxID=3160862 RepID=UPI0032E481D3